MLPPPPPPLLLLLFCLQTSLQVQSPPPGRCDVPMSETYSTCTSCALTNICPHGFSSVGTTNCSYVVDIGGRKMTLDGCQHNCFKQYMQPRCCPQSWGPLCLPCPSWSGKTCNFHGTCKDGDVGNGTCICDEGFSGFACQECKNPNAFGPNCDKVCRCVHGVCNKGPDGDGQCLCNPPYSGAVCGQVSNSCLNCSPYSYCKGEGDAATCECLPGYRKKPDGKCARICSTSDCDVNAQCSSQGSKINCACNPGYQGDGKICVPINPCSVNNGGCPVNSTVCVFKGPNKSSCECMRGMSPTGFSPEFGCQLVSACSVDTCSPTAICRTELDGQPRCVCEASQIGDGRRCYGNLMERMIELDRSGSQRGNLTGAVALFGKGCSLLLSHNGPFTAFMPLLKSPLTDVHEEEVCKNHLILGQHLYKDLVGREFNLYGGARLRGKDNKKFILMDNPRRLYTIVQQDLPAANGIIHIVDQPVTNTLPVSPPRDEQFADKTIGEILTRDDKFNRFLSLVDNCGSRLPLRGPGPLTVFVPTNQAVDRARDGSILYMLTDAKHKLQELLRHHIFSQAVLTADDLAALPQLQTMANQIVAISVSDDGEIVLGEKNIRLASANIVASNGIIHMIDGLLYPPSILPILPHRCDKVVNKIVVGPCVHCAYIRETQCPDGSTDLDKQMFGCSYVIDPVRGRKSLGCGKMCNVTERIPKCCKGFFGPDCKPCIGGFQNPCYNKGTCFDGIHGNGSCSCHSGFKGVACHICSDPSKHGSNCDEECSCVHGVCDSRPGSSGKCRTGSCSEGYSGENCDIQAMPCNSDGLQRHCHIHAYCTHAGFETTCVCRDGYEGDGLSCSPINPCLGTSRGGCDTNAVCVYAGPGNSSCLCLEGWTGDGSVCVEINNCELESRGGCSLNADCTHIGPGQSECVCKTGYMGNGIVCDLINPCLRRNGGCHPLAKCEQVEGQVPGHTCTCPEGYLGDGTICYGTLVDELDMNPKLYPFYRWINKYNHASKDLSGNVTLLAPSSQALRNMTSAQTTFWSNRHRLPHFLRAHFLQGIYSLEDLDKLEGKKLPSLSPPTTWEISNSSGSIHVGNASILAHNLPAINGYIHIIDQILWPPPSDLPPVPPTLMTLLNSSSNFTLFRQYALMYNLSGELGTSDFTLLLPTDEAIRRHLSSTNSTLLEADVVKYHVIPNLLLFPDHLTDVLLKSTLLGADYQVQFHLDANNQTAVNDVLLDGNFVETQAGVVMFLPHVLTVRRNRCSQPVNLRISGRCSDCSGPPRCLISSKPIRSQFPNNMRSNCKFRKRVGTRRKSVPGCVIDCLRVTKDHSCCPGYYGHECFKCPGDVGSWCSNHGECQDGNLGNGECRCYEGFHGTACEDCEPGRYGVNCSSKCVCDHGKCDDGLAGSGRCECNKGWKGASCSVEIKDDACGGVCDENANCITGPNGSAATCVCVAGYRGTGTSCQEVDLCLMSNGGCSRFANCTKVSAGVRTCTCKEGYTGDGVLCLEMDGCLVNNGGCHKSAQCIRTGPNTVACRCLEGFQGSGRFCYPVNPCRINNGGCSKYARCQYLGDGQKNCTCFRNHVGDGISCRGTTNSEIVRNQENSFLARLISLSDTRGLSGDGPFTVFVPVDEDDQQSSVNEWMKSGRLSDVVRYHIVSCEALTLSDLKSTESVVATSGHTLHFSLHQDSVWINNRSRIIKSDYTTSNGVIHHVDSMLTPYGLKDKPHLDAMNFTSAIVFYGYSRFYKLIEDAGLLPVLQMSIHQPFTMFWPTDEALNSLPAERQRWLSSPDNQDQLAATVKAHIIRNSRVNGVSQPDPFSSFRTMHGSTIKYSCDKALVGAVLINDNAARVVERYLNFREGVAYGIDQLLEPPGLGAHCDSIENKTTFGRCGRCLFPPSCPLRHVDTGNRESCVMRRHRFRSPYSPWYLDLDDPFSRLGCKRVCQFPSWVQKCCKNHYGPDCQACPGGVEAPCGNHGDCNDGLRGLGVCVCHNGFRGRACELCQSGYYGPNCTACKCGKEGSCDDGIEGSGLCHCNAGWTGSRCQIELGSIPEECRLCHAQAECVPGDGCQCKPGFQGNGTFCEAEPPPDLCSEYNGGCHQDAICNQMGLLVNCTCHSNYLGDGFSCEPLNRCVQEPNGGCSDFASCKFTGPNQRECECLPGYVGNGVQCLEKVVPPVDRCLESNGFCDPVASCKDLHYHANTAGVYHLRSPEGKYKMNFSQADAACQADGATLANLKQLGDAQQMGMHMCVAGWMSGGKVGYPTRFPSSKCGENHVGVVLYKDPVDQSSKYDAYCYRLKDVSCECPADYVGDGDYCNGVLTSVLATTRNFSIFYKFLMDYSGSSSEGRQLMEFLSHRKSEVTLFVPHDAGFSRNQILSGRDLEYHISTNHGRRPFKELRHQEVIKSKLGFDLTVTYGNNASYKLVNQHLLLEWDIPAVNGIIHVIEAPLTAPPTPVSPHASHGHAHSSGTVSAILVSLILACVLAGLGYYVFKNKTNPFRFQYFRNEGEDGSGGGRTKPTLVSIPNPLYSGSRAFTEPFGADSQEAEPAEPEEPPKILDLDQ